MRGTYLNGFVVRRGALRVNRRLEATIIAFAASLSVSLPVADTAMATTVTYGYDDRRSPPGYALWVYGDPVQDAIGLSYYDGEYIIGEHGGEVTISEGSSFGQQGPPTVPPSQDSCRQTKPNEVRCRFDFPLAAGIYVYGRAGDDYLSSALRPISGQGPTYLYGSDGEDSFIGGTGADHLRGAAGDDYLIGSSGDDEIGGGGGDDVLEGGRGDDDLSWGGQTERGRDMFFGHPGRDRVDAVHDKGHHPRAAADYRIGCGAGRDIVIVDRLDPRPHYCEEVRMASM